MIIYNEKENKKEMGEKRTLHDKVVYNKSSMAGLEQHSCKPPFYYNPTIEFKGTMLLCIHPIPQTLP